MQVRPIIFTLLIALGFALIANSWVISDTNPESQLLQNSLALSPILQKSQQITDPLTNLTKSGLVTDTPMESATLAIIDSSSVSDGIKDIILVAKIQRLLFRIDGLDTDSISLQARAGHVVLEGQASNEDSKRLVESSVRRVAAVKSVENKIIVNSDL